MTFKKVLFTTALITLTLIHSLAFAADQPFTFSVFGDSRLPGNMNFNINQQDQIAKYIAVNFHGVAMDQCDLRYSESGQLVSMRVPTGDNNHKDITFDGNGWPARIYDTNQIPNLTLREEGLSWVYQSVIAAVTGEGDQGFTLHTGDISYNGYYGTSPETSVYWADFKNRFFDQLPAGTPNGLYGRFFPAVGNHETWLDPQMEGLRNTVPYLQKYYNVTANQHMYSFDFNDSRFIFLDTGGYKPAGGWGADSKPGYDEQMEALRELLKNAQQENIKQVFITLHKPPFCGAGHGHLNATESPTIKYRNPHATLVPFANDISITVFSGHVHSSELYYKDKIRYLVLGGGGADQVYSTVCADDDPFCQDELYWRGAKREMEYNYLNVVVNGAEVKFELNRWRPDAKTPKQTCLIDSQMKISGCRD